MCVFRVGVGPVTRGGEGGVCVFVSGVVADGILDARSEPFL